MTEVIVIVTIISATIMVAIKQQMQHMRYYIRSSEQNLAEQKIGIIRERAHKMLHHRDLPVL